MDEDVLDQNVDGEMDNNEEDAGFDMAEEDDLGEDEQ